MFRLRRTKDLIKAKANVKENGKGRFPCPARNAAVGVRLFTWTAPFVNDLGKRPMAVRPCSNLSSVTSPLHSVYGQSSHFIWKKRPYLLCDHLLLEHPLGKRPSGALQESCFLVDNGSAPPLQIFSLLPEFPHAANPSPDLGKRPRRCVTLSRIPVRIFHFLGSGKRPWRCAPSPFFAPCC